jgi:hypothetical protein
MPYYDPRKPLVNGWFSATKRRLADCASEPCLTRLKKENGLTVLYQYLHRYADPRTNMLQESFVLAIDRLAADPHILIGSVSSIMRRLRQVQGVFVVFEENSFWLINVNDGAVENLQIVSERPISAEMQGEGIETHGNTLVIKKLPGSSITQVRVLGHEVFSHKNARQMSRDRKVTFSLPFGELRINFSKTDWRTEDNRIVAAGGFLLSTRHSGTGLPLLSALPRWEEARLLSDQIALIAREVLLKGRSLNVEKYLDSSHEISMENYDNW